jgi:hypothetical protein
VSESLADQITRLQLMAGGDPKYDLSPNDRAAIGRALDALTSQETKKTAGESGEVLPMRPCEYCGTESPAKWDWSGWNKSPLEQRGWRIVCWHAMGDDSDVVVLHNESVCRDVLRAQCDEERERVRRMRELLDSAVGNLDRHMPDGCGARAVLTSKIRDAIADKWDEGEWDDGEGYRRLKPA